MAGPWHVQRDDHALFVFNRAECPRLADGEGHESELAAWQYGLTCLEIQREALAAAIKAARSEVRRLSRSASKPQEQVR